MRMQREQHDSGFASMVDFPQDTTVPTPSGRIVAIVGGSARREIIESVEAEVFPGRDRRLYSICKAMTHILKRDPVPGVYFLSSVR